MNRSKEEVGGSSPCRPDTTTESLPPELLEMVLRRVSFGDLVNFRAVSKEWKCVILPGVARFVQPSDTSTLLYFDVQKDRRTMTPWFRYLWDSTHEKIVKEAEEIVNVPRYFQPAFLKSAKAAEQVRLVASEGGLLFFCFTRKSTMFNKAHMFREFAVCNPLTGQSKLLDLPETLMAPIELWEEVSLSVLVGVVFCEVGRYRLVVAGADLTETHCTYIYSSEAGTWIKLAMEFEMGPTDRLSHASERSVCLNGSLYWYGDARDHRFEIVDKFVLKYDLQADTWSRLMVTDDNLNCGGVVEAGTTVFDQIVSCKGKIMLSHVHVLSPPLDDLQPGRNVNEVIEIGCRVWTDTGNFTRGLAPEIAMMADDARVDIETWLMNDKEPFLGDSMCNNYYSFSQGNFVYHVMLRYQHDVDADAFMGEHLHIVIHDLREDSYSKVIRESDFLFEGRLEQSYHIELNHVWAYSPSFASV